MAQPSGVVKYTFMPERGGADPDYEAQILAGQLSGFGYRLLRVEVAYGGHDMFQGINVSVDGPINDAHLADLRTRGFPVEGEERGIRPSLGAKYNRGVVD